MNATQAAHTRQILSLLGRTRAAVPFFYCAADATGSPALLVDAEELDESVVLALVFSARRKRFARGLIRRDAEGLLEFQAEGRGLGELVADLSGPLDAAVPGLRFARVDPVG